MNHIAICLLFFLIGCSSQSRPGPALEKTSIQSQLEHIDFQMNHLDQMISAARSRPSDATVDAEISSYESQKIHLMHQKSALEAQLKN